MKHIYTFFCLFLLSGVASADNVIVGAFGQKLGAVVDEKLEFVTDLNSGALRYKFKPDKLYPMFTYYSVHVTPVSKRIYLINMVGDIGVNRCKEELKILDVVLKQKYPTLHRSVDQETITFEESDKSRMIRTYCSGMLHLFYRDNALKKLILEEKASLVDKSNF